MVADLGDGWMTAILGGQSCGEVTQLHQTIKHRTCETVTDRWCSYLVVAAVAVAAAAVFAAAAAAVVAVVAVVVVVVVVSIVSF